MSPLLSHSLHRIYYKFSVFSFFFSKQIIDQADNFPMYKGGISRNCQGRTHATHATFDVNHRIHFARWQFLNIVSQRSFTDPRFCMIQSTDGTRYQTVSISLIARLTTNNVIIPVHLSSPLPFPSLARIHGLSSALLLPSSSYAARKRIGNKCMSGRYFLFCFIF